MAKLPTPLDLGGIPQVTGSMPVATVDRAGAAYEDASQKLGAGIEQLGRGIGAIAHQQEFQQDHLDMARAKANFLTKKIELDNTFTNDQDYTTWDKRYGDQIGQIQSDSASMISNPRAREMFSLSVQDDVARGRVGINRAAFGKAADANVADANSRLDVIRQAAVTANDPADAEGLIRSGNAIIDGLQGRNYITAQAAQKTRDDFFHKYATDKINLLASIPGREQEAIDLGRQVDADRQRILQQAGPRTTASPSTSAGGMATFKTASGLPVHVNSQAAAAFQGFVGDLEATGYKIDDIGGYNPRNIAGTNTPSKHATGMAIDINSDRNPDTGAGGKLITDMPPNVSQMAAKWGLKWGGDFHSKKDAMHFEFVGGAPTIQTVAGNGAGAPLGKPALDQAPTGTQAEQATADDSGTTLPGDKVATATTGGQPGMGAIGGGAFSLYAEQAVAKAQQARMIDMEREHKLQVQALKDQSDAAENTVIQDAFSNQPKISAQDVSQNTALSNEAKLRMIGVINRVGKGEPIAEVSRQNTMQLLSDMRLPDGNPHKITDTGPIYKAYIDGGLNRADFGFLQKEFSGLRSADGDSLEKRKAQFIEGIKASIDNSNPLAGKIDAEGKHALYVLETDLNRKIGEYRKAGKDPYDLLDPSKPDYMGAPKALAPYQKTLQQSIQSVTQQLTPSPGAGSRVPSQMNKAPAPRQPGESPADYLKRIGQ